MTALLALGALVPLAATQPAAGTPAAQEGFVPVSQLPPAEQLPAAPLVAAAYAFIWLATIVYVVLLWRRLGVVDRELATLKRDLAKP